MSLADDIDTTARIRALAARGLSDRQIGDALDLSARTVLRIRNRCGIASRRVRDEPEHGTQARYRRGCTCSRCCAANAATRRTAVRRAQARSQAQPTDRHGEPWTDSEDAQALTDVPVAALAARLGRTYYAVQNRRAFLARKNGGGKGL